MKDIILNPNCSEAVFRFRTVDPEKIHYILQAIADEIAANNPAIGKQKIPKYKTAKEYETPYGGRPSYAWDFLWDENDKRPWEEKIKEAKKRSYMHVQVWEIMRQ